jgi:Rieske Fe-S protein
VLTTATTAAGALALAACGSEEDGSEEAEPGGSNDAGGSPDSSPDGQGGDEGENGSGSGAGGEPLAALDEVPVGEAAGPFQTSGEEQVMLFRPDEATVACFSAICTHAGCTVEADGAELSCPCHQSVFDAATGEVLGGPAGEALPSINVRIEGDQIVAG